MLKPLEAGVNDLIFDSMCQQISEINKKEGCGYFHDHVIYNMH